MAIRIDGQTYYRTLETCLKVGISRATLFRWLKVGIVEDAMIRDRKGWRLFTRDDIDRIKDEASRVSRREVNLEEKNKEVS
jgi:predicted site-specific integrase-resolvase